MLSVAIGLFELTQDLVRARLMALSVMKATLVRAIAVLGLGVVVALGQPDRIPAAALVGTGLSARGSWCSRARRWRGTVVKFDRRRPLVGGQDRPAADAVADAARASPASPTAS